MLVDDDPGVRQGLKYQVEFADMTPVEELGPHLGDLNSYLQRDVRADAAISDFHLSPKGYAPFNGAELVAGWYKQNFPSLLCTRFEKAQIDIIRPHRRWIPTLLSPDDLNPDSLQAGLNMCIREISNEFIPARRPWRAQVHFIEPDLDVHGFYFLELPAWQRSEIVRFRLEDIPGRIREKIVPGYRCFATSNLGAEDVDDIYVSEWES
jgi:hypothetical protein